MKRFAASVEMSGSRAMHSTPAEPAPPCRFDAALHPHRSLSPHGFRWLMGIVIALNLIVGGWFLAKGAWPVFGFMGLDVLILWLCFRRSYADGREHETVRLDARELIVRKIDRNGATREWRLEPSWLQVVMDDPPRHESRLSLRSHGRDLVIGAFLSPEERLDFAHALRAALSEWKRDQIRLIDETA
jgi:uncharacterized membrane protein